MRIHDSMLEINTRLQKNPRTDQSVRSKASSKNESKFLDYLKNFQASPPADCQNAGAQIANVIWVQYPQMFSSKQEGKIKSGAYQALADI